MELAGGLVPPGYIAPGVVSLGRQTAAIRTLLAQRRLPDTGWNEATVEIFLRQLSAMDANNFAHVVGVGEREGRVVCGLVSRRHFGFAHGVGRGGDISGAQPKAAGSSLLYRLTNLLALDAVRTCGVPSTAAALVLPCATGLSLSIVLGAIRASRPDGAALVVVSRCDQRSALKAVVAAGCTPIVVPLRVVGDALCSDVGGIRQAIEQGLGEARGPSSVVAVLTTTSCFAPREPDDVVAIGSLCAELDVPHVVNHAYGLQSKALCKLINRACINNAGAQKPRNRASVTTDSLAVGLSDATASGAVAGNEKRQSRRRVDAIVSSTDKNFMVRLLRVLKYDVCV